MKRKLCMTVALLAVIVTALNLGFIASDEFYYDLENLPKGEELREDQTNSFITLSTGDRFFVYAVHATHNHPSAIRVAVINDRTGEDRTIYWQIGTLENRIEWSEEEGMENVIIVNDVPIDYQNGETYDCRDYPDFKYIPENKPEIDNGF